MIAIDTNIIVRLLTRDDHPQYEASYRLFQNADIFIPETVVLETEWVLRYAYDFEPTQICSAFRKLFGLENVRLQHPQLMAQVIDWHESGLDFADAFHLANSQHCTALKTFDERLVKRSRSLADCEVERL